MKIQYEFIKRDIAGETFLVPLGDSAAKFKGIIAINEVASFVWDLLQDGKNEEEIVQAVFAEFEAPEEEIRKDVSDFLGELREMEILGE